MEDPSILHALPSETVFDFLFPSQLLNNFKAKLANSSQTFWVTFWLAKTSHKQTSLTARLAVKPNL